MFSTVTILSLECGACGQTLRSGSRREHITEQHRPRDVNQHSRRCCSRYNGMTDSAKAK